MHWASCADEPAAVVGAEYQKTQCGQLCSDAECTAVKNGDNDLHVLPHHGTHVLTCAASQSYNCHDIPHACRALQSLHFSSPCLRVCWHASHSCIGIKSGVRMRHPLRSKKECASQRGQWDRKTLPLPPPRWHLRDCLSQPPSRPSTSGLCSCLDPWPAD